MASTLKRNVIADANWKIIYNSDDPIPNPLPADARFVSIAPGVVIDLQDCRLSDFYWDGIKVKLWTR